MKQEIIEIVQKLLHPEMVDLSSVRLHEAHPSPLVWEVRIYYTTRPPSRGLQGIEHEYLKKRIRGKSPDRAYEYLLVKLRNRLRVREENGGLNSVLAPTRPPANS